MISAIVLTKNEEKNIEGCLKSIDWVDEIVVIDSFSDDQTVNIAKNLCSKVIVRKFTNFSDQRNFAISQCNGDWIFFLDADERLDSEISEEIRKIEKDDSSTLAAYKIDRLEYFMGSFILHGGFGRGQHNHHVRLWRSGKLKFIGDVHEKAVVTGDIGRLTGVIHHYSNEGNISGFIKKLNNYTDTEASMYFCNKKIRKLDLLVRPLMGFINRFIRLRGYQDGMRGLIYFSLLAFYDFVSIAKKVEKSLDAR